MQQTPTPPATPGTPAIPAPARILFDQGLSSFGSNWTADDVSAARIRLDELRTELQDAAERRNSVATRLRSADVDARPGYQGRLAVLDQRIIGIEQEITQLNIGLRNAPSEAVVAATPAQTVDPDIIAFQSIMEEIVPIVAIVSVFVFAPISIAIARLLWRRATHGRIANAAAGPDPMTQQKLDQLQQAVDTIAIEVERISEGQRFVTRLMSDRSLSAGPAEPVRAGNRAAVPSERG